MDFSRQGGSPWWVTIIAILLAFLICGIFIAANGMNPFLVYSKMVKGAFGTPFGLTETLVKSILASALRAWRFDCLPDLCMEYRG